MACTLHHATPYIMPHKGVKSGQSTRHDSPLAGDDGGPISALSPVLQSHARHQMRHFLGTILLLCTRTCSHFRSLRADCPLHTAKPHC